MTKVYVVNDLPHGNIVVSEGAGSSFSLVNSIAPGHYHVMRVDSQATYREILLVLDSGTLQAKFSTDDCQECKEVRITGFSASELLLVKIPKISRNISEMTADANLSRFGQNVLRFFRIGRKRPSRASRPTAAILPAAAPQPVAAIQPAAAPQLVEAAPQSGNAPIRGSVPDGSSVQLAVAASDGGSAPTGSSLPDVGSAPPSEASLLVKASQTNGEIQTDGAENQAKVPAI